MNNKFIIIDWISKNTKLNLLISSFNKKFDLKLKESEIFELFKYYFRGFTEEEEQKESMDSLRLMITFKDKKSKEILNISLVDKNFNLEDIYDKTDKIININVKNLLKKKVSYKRKNPSIIVKKDKKYRIIKK